MPKDTVPRRKVRAVVQVFHAGFVHNGLKLETAQAPLNMKCAGHGLFTQWNNCQQRDEGTAAAHNYTGFSQNRTRVAPQNGAPLNVTSENWKLVAEGS